MSNLNCLSSSGYKGKFGYRNITIFISDVVSGIGSLKSTDIKINIPKFILTITVGVFVALFIYSAYVIKTYIDWKYQIDMNVHTRVDQIADERFTPYIAKIYELEEEVKDLKAHSKIIYFKEKKKRRVQVAGTNKYVWR